MKEYSITWTIDITAPNPRDAAAQALAMQRDTASTATVFAVSPRNEDTDMFTIDLSADCTYCGGDGDADGCSACGKVDERDLSPEQLDDKYNPDGDGEHPNYTRKDWRFAVENDETLLGYWGWVEFQIQQE